jgi:predicted transcriptional regulator
MGPLMTLDELLLNALEHGPATVKEIAKRLERPLRLKLNKLRVRGLVVREGRGGAHRQFTYRLVQRDLAAKALVSRGGLSGGPRPNLSTAVQQRVRS